MELKRNNYLLLFLLMSLGACGPGGDYASANLKVGEPINLSAADGSIPPRLFLY